MENWKLISPKELSENPFRLLSESWALLTAGDAVSAYNTMTVSWGGVGVLWNKNVATVYVRPQRHTFGFMEKSGHFTLSFFGEEYKKALSFCGSKSGRDYDKAKECGLTPISVEDGVAFEEAKLILACRKLYWNDILPENFCDTAIDGANYPAKDYHRMYIGEILGSYQK